MCRFLSSITQQVYPFEVGWQCNGIVPLVPVCAWQGVSCSSGEVTQISLTLDDTGVFFIGVLPNSLGYLRNLQYLNLGQNHFSGSTIPTTFAYLTNLKYLGLNTCRLVGEIPTILGLMKNLQYLDLAGNSLVGTVPSELGRLRNLIGLSLIVNSFSGAIPSSLCNILNLKILWLERNQFGCSPTCLMTRSYQWADFLSDSTLVPCTNNPTAAPIGSSYSYE